MFFNESKAVMVRSLQHALGGTTVGLSRGLSRIYVIAYDDRTFFINSLQHLNVLIIAQSEPYILFQNLTILIKHVHTTLCTLVVTQSRKRHSQHVFALVHIDGDIGRHIYAQNSVRIFYIYVGIVINGILR